MAKYCDICRQSYSVEYDACPFCEVVGAVNGTHVDRRTPVNGVLKNIHPQPQAVQTSVETEMTKVSDSEIDLGSPVVAAGQDAASGPPSGASFVSWVDHIPGTNDTPPDKPAPRLNAFANAKVLTSPDKTSDASADADGGEDEIDLSSPLGQPRDPSDPPSGASFASWTTLLPARGTKEAEEPRVEFGPLPASTRAPVAAASERGRAAVLPAPAEQPVRTARGLIEMPSGTHLPQPVQRGRWVPGLMIGAVVALGACLGLWLAGVEPPQTWRHQIRQWLGKTPPADTPKSNDAPR
jgi:hypothetical protein